MKQEWNKTNWLIFSQKYPVKVHIFWEGHKILEISTLDLYYVVLVKLTVEIPKNFLAFSEYMNFKSDFICALSG